MSESGLSIGFEDLVGEVGSFLGFGRKTYTSYSTSRKVLINSIVQSGVRQVYYPPAVIAETTGYEWSWLRPVSTIDIESGTSDYDLPDNFGRLIGTLHYPSAEYREDIVVVSVSKLLQMRAASDLTGAPAYAAIRYKESDRTDGQRQEILFFPEPDDDWTLSYEYESYSGVISDTYPYPLGGMQLAELYIESCLSVAENRVNEEPGTHTQKFKELLVDAIKRDGKRGARIYGNMGDAELEQGRFYRGITGTTVITYNGDII
jgi:hypothetical protein